jgi:hypothetical protein
VDRILRGHNVSPEIRTLQDSGAVSKTRSVVKGALANGHGPQHTSLPISAEESPTNGTEELEPEPVEITHIMPYGVNKGKLLQVVRITRAPVEVVDDINKADLLLTTKNYYRRKTHALQVAEQKGKPVYVLRRNTSPQIEQFIQAVTRRSGSSRRNPVTDVAVSEAEEAASRIQNGEHEVELNPQGAYIRRLQHEIAEKHDLTSSSTGKEPSRHVVFYHR